MNNEPIEPVTSIFVKNILTTELIEWFTSHEVALHDRRYVGSEMVTYYTISNSIEIISAINTPDFNMINFDATEKSMLTMFLMSFDKDNIITKLNKREDHVAVL